MSQLVEVSATGTVSSNPEVVWGVTLTAGSDAASVELRDNGSSGEKKLTIKAAAESTEPVPLPGGAYFSTDVHATLSGTNPVVAVEYGASHT